MLPRWQRDGITDEHADAGACRSLQAQRQVAVGVRRRWCAKSRSDPQGGRGRGESQRRREDERGLRGQCRRTHEHLRRGRGLRPVSDRFPGAAAVVTLGLRGRRNRRLASLAMLATGASGRRCGRASRRVAARARQLPQRLAAAYVQPQAGGRQQARGEQQQQQDGDLAHAKGRDHRSPGLRRQG